MVRAVDVKSSDKFRRGHYSVRFILLTLGAILRWDKTCGAGTRLLVIRFRETQVGTATIVSAASISGSSRVWVNGEQKKIIKIQRIKRLVLDHMRSLSYVSF